MLPAILQWVIISSSKLNAGITTQVAKEMRQKVALIAEDQMAPHTTASRSKARRRYRKQDGWCGKPPAPPLAPGSETRREQRTVTEIMAESVLSSTLDLLRIPYGAHSFPSDNRERIFLVSVGTCKRKKMFWKVGKGASLGSSLVLPF